jgi:hypothetical protein
MFDRACPSQFWIHREWMTRPCVLRAGMSSSVALMRATRSVAVLRALEPLAK